jgi:hypothetical protein
MVCGVSQFIDKDNNLLQQTFGKNIWSDPNHLRIMLWGNQISAPTVMMRRTCYEKLGLYTEEVIYSDWEMWLRILLFSNWQIGFIDKFLALYRTHGNNVSLNQSPNINYTRNLQVLLRLEYYLQTEVKNTSLPKYDLLRKTILSSILNSFYLSAEEGRAFDAVRYLSNYLKRNPKAILQPRWFASISYRMTQGFTKALFPVK